MSFLKKQLGEAIKLGFLGDSFISEFLEASGIYKKSNYQKEIAEQMTALAKIQEKQLNNLGK